MHSIFSAQRLSKIYKMLKPVVIGNSRFQIPDIFLSTEIILVKRSDFAKRLNFT